MPDSRFTAAVATHLRRAIREAGGIEVLAVGDIDGGNVIAVTVVGRCTEDRVTAPLERPHGLETRGETAGRSDPARVSYTTWLRGARSHLGSSTLSTTNARLAARR